MSIRICKERCVVINCCEHENNDLFIVFMLPGNGLFLKGLVKAEVKARAGEINLFHWANIEFVDDDDEDATLEILDLKMDMPMEPGPPAF